LKKLAILGVLAGAIALLVFAQQSNAKESDEAEIRTMEAAMMKGFAARDLDNALAVYVQDDTLFVFDAAPPRQYVGIKAWRADNESFLALFQGPLKAEMSDLSVTTNGNRQGRQTARPDPSRHRRVQEDQWQMDDRRGAPLVPGRSRHWKGRSEFKAVAASAQ
jgi:hypothetical protein